MIYDKNVNNVVVNRDVYGEHFSPDIKINYMISVFGDVIVEGENPKELAKELKKISQQLEKWSNHFARMKS